MLTEQFIASVGVPTTAPGTNVAKDAAIFIHQFQPLLAQQLVLKKSATPQNCLAVSSTHIFAAQAEKAVVHVYSREKGNQEATVPFTERITCIALACDETVLVLGTADGRIFLWEIASGRQISTSQAHLQAVTALAVDGAENFLLSSSKDSTVHVWSIPSLLSFANAGVQSLAPIRTFTSHREEVTALIIGRSAGFANIAVSASSDKTCLIWDYHTNAVLRTYLLSGAPTCLAIDACERAVYVGYPDGSIQQLDFYTSISRSANLRNVSNQATAPIQPLQSSLWEPSDKTVGAALSISISFDGCTAISGHESGATVSWDIGKNGMSSSLLQTPLPGPVTNLEFLPVTGSVNGEKRNLKVPAIVKPKFGAFDNASGTVPSNYAINVELPTDISGMPHSGFVKALNDHAFPGTLLDDGLSELFKWHNDSHSSVNHEPEESEDFMSLDEPAQSNTLSLEQQNSALKAELDALRRLQKASFEKIEEMSAEKKALLIREQKKSVGKDGTASRAHTNGTINGDVEMEHSSSDDD